MHIKCISILCLKGVCRMVCRWSKVPACTVCPTCMYLSGLVYPTTPQWWVGLGMPTPELSSLLIPRIPVTSFASRLQKFPLPTSPSLAMADIATAAGPSELQAKQVVYCGGKYHSAILICAKFISILVCSLPPEVGGNLRRLSFPIRPSNRPAA